MCVSLNRDILLAYAREPLYLVISLQVEEEDRKGTENSAHLCFIFNEEKRILGANKCRQILGTRKGI